MNAMRGLSLKYVGGIVQDVCGRISYALRQGRIAIRLSLMTQHSHQKRFHGLRALLKDRFSITGSFLFLLDLKSLRRWDETAPLGFFGQNLFACVENVGEVVRAI